MKTLFEIDGYHVVLSKIQNVYPVEMELNYYYWGFKFTSQIFEYFSYLTKEEADKAHDAFIDALNIYWTLGRGGDASATGWPASQVEAEGDHERLEIRWR